MNFDVLQVLRIDLPRGVGRQSKFYARLILLNWLAFSTSPERLFGKRQVAFKRRADGFFAFEWEKGGVSKQSFLDGINYLKGQGWLEERYVLNKKSQGQRVKWYKPNQTLLDALARVSIEENTDNFYANIADFEWTAHALLKAYLLASCNFDFFDVSANFTDVCKFAGVSKSKTQAEYFNKLLNDAASLVKSEKNNIIGPWAILSKNRNAPIRKMKITIDDKGSNPSSFILNTLNDLDKKHKKVKVWDQYFASQSLEDEEPLGIFDSSRTRIKQAKKSFLDTRLGRVDGMLKLLVIDLAKEYILGGGAILRSPKTVENKALELLKKNIKQLLESTDLPNGEIKNYLAEYLYNEHGNWLVYLFFQIHSFYITAESKQVDSKAGLIVIG